MSSGGYSLLYSNYHVTCLSRFSAMETGASSVHCPPDNSCRQGAPVHAPLYILIDCHVITHTSPRSPRLKCALVVYTHYLRTP